MNKANPTIASVVILRAIAALWVCAIHIGMIANFQGPGISNFIIKEGQNGVAIFFVISGFILPYSLYQNKYQTRSFVSFLIRRSIRIDPPYWASIILIILLTPLALSSLNYKQILLHLAYAIPFVKGADWYSGVYWTLSIEFQFYILLGLFYSFLMRINPKVTCTILLLLTFIFTSLLRFNYRGIIFTNIYDFVFGFILFLGYIKKIDRSQLITTLLIFAAYVMVSVSIKTGFTPLATCAVIFFYTNNKKVPVLTWLGSLSYSLYLIHIPVSTFFANKVHGFITNPGMLFLSCLAASILSSYVYYKIIEKPCIKLSKRIVLKKAPAQVADHLVYQAQEPAI